MSHVFSAAGREAFRAAPRVAVFSIARETRAPLRVPIGYVYTAGGEVGLWMEADTPKARALALVGCFSLCVHDEVRPYRHVSVPGPVTSLAPIDWERELIPLIKRYWSGAEAQTHIASLDGPAGVANNLFVCMRPQHWRAEQI